MNALLVLPIVIPLATGSVSLLLWKRLRWQRFLAVAGSTLVLAAGLALFAAVWRGGIQVSFVGGWPAPYGITLVADLLSSSLVVLVGVVGLACSLYSLSSIDAGRQAFGYYPLTHFLLMGVAGAFLTGDIFNLFVWFEVLLMASFVLLALGGERRQLQGGIIYVALNLLSSALFLAAVGILYGVVGTLNLADLHEKIRTLEDPGRIRVLAMLFLTAFGIKAALFPLFFWLPASYHTPPAAVSALFAGLLTKVGIYALIRVFALLIGWDDAPIFMLILMVAGLTMLTGVLGALVQADVRRLLAFLHISQVGFLAMGLGLAGVTTDPALKRLALAGTVFSVVHHMLAITSLFLVAGMVHRLSGTYDLGRLGSLYRDRPLVCWLFLIPGLALAGVPPLSGFFAKLILLRAGLEIGQAAIVMTALLVSLLTLFAVMRLWAEAFWKDAATEIKDAPGEEFPAPTEDGSRLATRRAALAMVLPPLVLAFLTVAVGLGGEYVVRLALHAADQLLEPAAYVRAVLGGAP